MAMQNVYKPTRGGNFKQSEKHNKSNNDLL